MKKVILSTLLLLTLKLSLFAQTKPDLASMYSQAKDADLAGISSPSPAPNPGFSADTQVQILDMLSSTNSEVTPPTTAIPKETYFSVENVPLRTILHLLAKRCGLNYMEPSQDLSVIDEDITLEMRKPEPRTLLDWLMKHKNLELYDADTGIYTIRQYSNAPAFYRFKLTDNFIDRFKGSATSSGGGGSSGSSGSAGLGGGGGNAVSASQSFTVENGGKYGDIEGLLQKVAAVEDKTAKMWYYEEKQTVLYYGNKKGAECVGRYLEIANQKNPNIRIDVRIYATGNNPQSQLGVDWSAMMSPGLTFGLQPSGQNLNGGTNGGGFSSFNTLQSLVDAFKDPMSTLILKNNLQATLNFFVSETKAEAVTEPSAVTANDREVAFNATEQIPYVSGSSSTGSGYGSSGSSGSYDNTAFVNVGATINILPRIQDGNRIKLGTAISISQLEQMVTISSGDSSSPPRQVPQTAGRAYNGEFTINSGDTIVIAGMKTHSISKTINKVPVLGDIPVIGKLFRNSSDSKNNAYLTIFITATKLDEYSNPRIPEGHVTPQDQYPDNDNNWMTAQPNARILGRSGLIGDKAVINAKREALDLRTQQANLIISRRLSLEGQVDALSDTLDAKNTALASLHDQEKMLVKHPNSPEAQTMLQQVRTNLAATQADRDSVATKLADCKAELAKLAKTEVDANAAKERAEDDFSNSLKQEAAPDSDLNTNKTLINNL